MSNSLFIPTDSHVISDKFNTPRWPVVVRGIQLGFITAVTVTHLAFRLFLERLHLITPHPETVGRILAAMLERMGPTYIKLGQLLSCRADLIGENIARPLARLRENVDPVPTTTIIKTIEESCGTPLEQLFNKFTDTPIATGSIAQVHLATLKQGQQVAVKVQRPGIKTLMTQDFVLLHHMGALLERVPGFKNVPFRDVFKELEAAIMAQLDFAHEISNNQKFQRYLEKRQHVRIPRLVHELCNPFVITMEYIPNLAPASAIQSEQTRRTVAKAGLEMLYQMIFVDGFVHADLHPGNVFFREIGEIVVLDFGLVAILNNDLRQKFREFFFAMVTNQGDICAKIVHDTAQSLAPGFDPIAYSKAMEAMVDRFAGCRVQEFEVARFAAELFDLQRRFGIRGSTAFTMTIISLLLFEGILKTLDPTMDFQAEAYAFMLTLATETLG